MPWTPYTGDSYWNIQDIERWCEALAERLPDWVTLDRVGVDRGDRPLQLLTLGRADGARDERPGFWLDGGTHAAEWAGVMATVFALSRWVEALEADDGAMRSWLERHTLYVLPCVAPQAYQALLEGQPFVRSTLRPPPQGTVRVGLEPQDIDGDGRCLLMRWRHPAGPFVSDPEHPLGVRQRRLDDPADQAWFLCSEGRFLQWDGHRWGVASRRFGLDLNRNFPGSWAPFSMFGMDGGRYPLSEPESRAVVDAFAARSHICAAVSNHTYTGCLLTQPYRKDSPLGKPDQRLMERLARDSVRGTGYRVFRTYPDFAYDLDKSIVGVWSDTIATVFGVPGFTLELWDPYAQAGVTIEKPALAFMEPDLDQVQALMAHFASQPGGLHPWRKVQHPQLGEVEVGGLEYMRTIRNPPEALLAEECQRAFVVVDRLRKALPQVRASARCVAQEGALRCLELQLENLGCLSTSGLHHGEAIGASLPVSAQLTLPEGVSLVRGVAAASLPHMDGWGSMQADGAAHPIYPSLPERGHRSTAQWWLRGSGAVQIDWQAGRAGRGTLTLKI